MNDVGSECAEKTVAEFLGTFWLVFGGCGSAVLAAGFPDLGIGFAGVAPAFGLTVLTMAYAVGGISGGHFNPAVSLGLMVAGKFPPSSLVPYIITQVVGAIAAAVLYLVASGKAGFELGGFAANGYGELGPAAAMAVLARASGRRRTRRDHLEGFLRRGLIQLVKFVSKTRAGSSARVFAS